MGSLALVTSRQPTEPRNPLQRAFDDVPMTSQPLGRLDTPAGDPGNDAPPTQHLPAGRIVIALVRVQLARPAPRPPDRPGDRRDLIDHRLERQVVITVGPGDDHRQRDATTLAHRVNLRTRLAPVDRAGAGQVPPFTALTCMASTDARDQSIAPAAPSTSSTLWCSRVNTSASTHSVNRRCAVAALTPNEAGSADQAQPVCSTYKIAASAARSSNRRRPPPWWRCGASGNNGYASSHNGSGHHFSTSLIVDQRYRLPD